MCVCMTPIEILELKFTVTETKKSLEGLNSRLEQAEGRISELEDMLIEII